METESARPHRFLREKSRTPRWRTRGEDDILPVRMAIRECRVSFHGFDGCVHTVTVTSETLFEAAAMALVSLTSRGS